MANKQLNTRIISKHDTTANWELHSTFVPLQGEIIIYEDSLVQNDLNIPLIKIGDGTTSVGDLPFITSTIPEEVLEHIANTVIHVTLEDKDNWNAKVDKDDLSPIAFDGLKKLTIGTIEYDGTEEKYVPVYEGNDSEDNASVASIVNTSNTNTVTYGTAEIAEAVNSGNTDVTNSITTADSVTLATSLDSNTTDSLNKSNGLIINNVAEVSTQYETTSTTLL